MEPMWTSCSDGQADMDNSDPWFSELMSILFVAGVAAAIVVAATLLGVH